jgi:Sec-independent protein translocase protein TatA
MRAVAVLFLICLALLQNLSPTGGKSPKHKQEQSPRTLQPSTVGQRGTEEAPLVVKQIPTPKTQEESAQETKDRQEKASNDRNLVIATFILAVIAAFQLFVFGYQAIQLRRTVEAAGEQIKDMKRAVAEASRSAAAMEEVSKHIETSVKTAAQQSESMKESVKEATRLASAMEVVSKEITISSKAAIDSVAALRERTAQQMRAYLTILVGSASFQERDKNIRFEARPLLINCGHTPAHKVAYKAKAAILPVPLPADFDFPLPGEFIGSSILGPQQTNILAAVIDGFVPDGEVADIKTGQQRALYIWGLVYYRDIFDTEQATKFCQVVFWTSETSIFGTYISRHNEAT